MQTPTSESWWAFCVAGAAWAGPRCGRRRLCAEAAGEAAQQAREQPEDRVEQSHHIRDSAQQGNDLADERAERAGGITREVERHGAQGHVEAEQVDGDRAELD